MKFTLGRLVATNGVAELMNSNLDFREFVSGSLKKYVECDWGDMCKDDSVMNDNKVASMAPIFKELGKFGLLPNGIEALLRFFSRVNIERGRDGFFHWRKSYLLC